MLGFSSYDLLGAVLVYLYIIIVFLIVEKAWKGDRYGNLVYRHTAMNFNPMMAQAATLTIAEVEELVEPGELDPDHVHTPGIFVKRIFRGTSYQKRIERRTTRKS